MRSILLSCIFLPLSFVSALGQSKTVVVPNTPPNGVMAAAAPSDYSAEPLVLEHFDNVYTMAADGTGSRLIMVATRVQSEAAVKALGVVYIGYASNQEHVEIAYVRVRRRDGTVIETPVAEAIDMPNPVTREAPFYSDLKQMQVPVRSLRVGDTLEWKAKV